MKTREECFVLVERVDCWSVIVCLSLNITGCRLERWEGLMEYMVRITGNS